jgi:hypothetical protein
LHRATRFIALAVVAGSLGGFHLANALSVGDRQGQTAWPRVPSITAEVRIESLEKEADVAITQGPKGAETGVNVLFDRKGAYGNPALTVTPNLWVYSFPIGVYFDDQPGPASSAVKPIHKVCDRSHGLC